MTTLYDVLLLVFAVLAGAFVGGVFFGGLWLTVQRLPNARYPALLILGSSLGRMAFALLSFYLIMGDSWQRLVAGVVGFILVRQLYIRQIRPNKSASTAVEQG